VEEDEVSSDNAQDASIEENVDAITPPNGYSMDLIYDVAMTMVDIIVAIEKVYDEDQHDQNMALAVLGFYLGKRQSLI
jgi:hypothetical protein